MPPEPNLPAPQTSQNKVEVLKQAKDALAVWSDIFRYAQADVPPLDDANAASFLATGGLPEHLTSAARHAAIPDDDYVRMRWFGIYQQLHNNGYHMFRIRIPNGLLTPPQLREIAALAQQYARGFVDITTRQCLQFHWLTLEAITGILPRLEKVNLVSTFACGDTPRNVIGCPLTGLLPDEITDASNAIQTVNRLFLDNPSEFSNLPRKFKAAIAGCPLHCHQPHINDLGIFGVLRQNPTTGQNQRGYGLMVGGGLAAQPHIAQSLRIFFTEDQLPAIARGVALIFRDSGYREKRNHARLKFLVADWGWQKFRDALEQKIGFTLDHDDSITGTTHALPTDHLGSGPQKQPGLSYLGLPVECGRLTADQLLTIATLAEKYAGQNAQIRLSNKQNLLFVNIPTANLEPLAKALTAAGLNPHASLWRQSLVTCTGAQFCNLALTETKTRAAQILRFLEEHCPIDSPIFLAITGCPNACAHYQIADIGLTGVLCNFHGTPRTQAFNIFLGGSLNTPPKFATLALRKVPADFVHKAIQQLITAYHSHRLTPTETFRQFLARHPLAQLTQWLTLPEMAQVQ